MHLHHPHPLNRKVLADYIPTQMDPMSADQDLDEMYVELDHFDEIHKHIEMASAHADLTALVDACHLLEDFTRSIYRLARERGLPQ